MSSINSIAASGMLAATRQLEISARNIADSGLPANAPADAVAAFQALRSDQVETSDAATAVTASATTGDDTDLASEAVNLTIASYSLAANAAVMRSAEKMQKQVIDILA
jgi:flagellar basal body rod protein FlgC